MHSINEIERVYQALIKSGRKIINLSSGNPVEHGFIFPPEILTKAYTEYLTHPTYHPDPKGLLAAREAIAHYYNDRNFRVDPSNILLTSGTSESFLHLFTLLCEAGDEILVPVPSYPLFDHIAASARINLIPYRLDSKDWQVDIDHLASQITPKTRAIAIISPHNPTGAVVSQSSAREITALANKHGLALICDEVFSEFYYGNGDFPRIASVAQPELCFTLNGISKMFALPHLKLGWIAVSGIPALVGPWVKRLEMTLDTFLACHGGIQAALPTIFERGRDFMKSYCDQVSTNRKKFLGLVASSPLLACVPPVGGIHALIRRDQVLLDEEEFSIRLMKEKGIYVHPSFFYDHEEGEAFIISFLREVRQDDFCAICGLNSENTP